MKKQPRKQIVYFDLDGTLADFDKAVKTHYPDFDDLSAKQQKEAIHVCKKQKDFFLNLELIDGAKTAFEELSKLFDCYILSTPSWSNPESWTHKRLWVEVILGEIAFKRLILTHHKHLNKGDYLIDDRIANGVDLFEGEHLHFGSEPFQDWAAVLQYLTVKQ